jgi:hypothetical protein
VWGLSLGHSLRGLLHLHVLLVGEIAAVVHHLEGVAVLAVLAVIGLNDATALDEFGACVVALEAFESRLLHFRDDV